MRKRKPLARNAPRDISDSAWYYVNRGSVNILIEKHNLRGEHVATAELRLTRKLLQAMLAELR